MTRRTSSGQSQTALRSDAHPFEINDFLVRAYQTHWLDWLPETLWATLEADHGFMPSRLWKDKAQAIRVTLTTNRPWAEFEIFENVGEAFNGESPNMTVLEPLTPGEAIATMRMLDVFRHDTYHFEVLSYVASCFFDSGFIACMNPNVQPLLDKLYESTGTTNLKLRDEVQRVFPHVWKHRDEIDKIRESDPVECQIRKLFQAYLYAEENDGQDILSA